MTIEISKLTGLTSFFQNVGMSQNWFIWQMKSRPTLKLSSGSKFVFQILNGNKLNWHQPFVAIGTWTQVFKLFLLDRTQIFGNTPSCKVTEQPLSLVMLKKRINSFVVKSNFSQNF